MRVLFVTVCYPPAFRGGGSVRAAGTLARGLVRAGAEVRVLTTDAFLTPDERPPREREEDGVSVTTLFVPAWLGRRANRYGLAPGLRRALRQETERADICLAQGVWTWPLTFVQAACRRHGLPYVLFPHGSLEARSLSEKAFTKRLYLQLVESRTLRGAAATLFSSEMEHARSRSVTGDLPAIIVPNALEPGEPRNPLPGLLHERLALPRDRLLVGISGRINPRKGFHLLVPALADADRRIHCVFVGPDDGGHMSAVERLATESGVRKRIHFLGHVEGNELDDVYASLDLLALPSLGESFGNVVPESLAQGTEVMVSEEVPLAGYVEERGFGTVVTAATTEAWRTALNAWAARPSEFDGERAARVVRADFDLEAVGRDCLEQLRTIATRSS